MIDISVRHYRGIHQADISCALVALLWGENGAGKTSITEAAAAALTGITLDKRLELTKGEAKGVLHECERHALAEMAVVKVATEAGSAAVRWPECEMKTEGDPPRASLYAVGALSLPLMSAKDRAAALEPYLRAEPTEEDLRLEMQDHFRPESIAALWAELQRDGWDATAAKYESNRTAESSAWAKLTGTAFGSNKAANWRPEGWNIDFEDVEASEIEEGLAEAKADLERAIASAAVDEAQIATWRAEGAAFDERTKAAAAAEKALAAAKDGQKIAQAERAKLSDAPATSGMPCPHCGEPVTLERKGAVTRLGKFTPIPEAELKKLREAIASADGALANAAAAVSAAEGVLRTARESLRQSQEAQRQLDANQGKTGSAARVTAARADIARIETTLRQRQLIDGAKALYRNWRRCDLTLDIVRPTGLRAKKLGEAVHAFNTSILAPLCEAAGWDHVTITPGLAIRVGERAYALRSRGEQWRARFILQVAQAKLDGSSMVIADDMPDLDSPSMNGLFAVLEQEQLPAIVCTASRRTLSPIDLSRFGRGRTWIVDDCIATPLEAAQDEDEAAQ